MPRGKYKRWILYDSLIKIDEIEKIAEEKGLKVLEVLKLPLSQVYHLYLQGTKSQIKDFDETIKQKGCTLRKRRPKGEFQI